MKCVELVRGSDVLLQMFDCVVEEDIVLCEEGVDFHPSLVAEHSSDFRFRETLGTVSLNGEGFERGAGGAHAFRDELGGEFFRDVERNLHEVRIPFGAEANWNPNLSACKWLAGTVANLGDVYLARLFVD